MDLAQYSDDPNKERMLEVPKGLKRIDFSDGMLPEAMAVRLLGGPQEKPAEAVRNLSKPTFMEIKHREEREPAEIEVFDETIANRAQQDSDRDLLAWTPPNAEQRKNSHIGTRFTYSDPTDELYFYDILNKWILEIIWRQFEDHIPREVVLEKLMECDYSFCKLLNTIDRCLETLPQRMKHLTVGQAQKLFASLGEEQVSIRELQKTTMRNFHLGEIRPYVIQFCRFYREGGRRPITCNCRFFMFQDYEPRYACKNCTKHLRDTTHYGLGQICLLCRSYHFLTGNPRETENIVWNDEEEHLIERWNALETELEKKITKEELNEMLEKKDMERWNKGKITNEEKNTLDYEFIPQKNMRRAYAEQLESFILPHFLKCQCQLKSDFSDREKVNYKNAIVEANGNMQEAANKLGVHVRFVIRFLDVYDAEDEMWEDYKDLEWHDRAGKEFPEYTQMYMPSLHRSE